MNEILEFSLRLLVALLLGGIIGLEREYRSKDAGQLVRRHPKLNCIKQMQKSVSLQRKYVQKSVSLQRKYMQKNVCTGIIYMQKM